MHNVEALDKLLRDELSATETYQQALNKFREDGDSSEAKNLMPIYEDHEEAVSTLQNQIRNMGANPSESSGAWGSWAQVIQGGANLMGKQAALKALQEGERNGIEDYQEVLQDPELPSDVRTLIENQLLPAQESHIRVLDRLLAVAA
ncbi:MAG: DUF2383 domain-containing protein [Methylobacter sp.]